MRTYQFLSDCVHHHKITPSTVISIEARRQFLNEVGRLPNAVVACVGGGSNAIGLFYEMLKHDSIRFVGVGEDTEDFGVFNASEFVAALLKTGDGEDRRTGGSAG